MLKYLTLALLGGAAVILASCSGGGSSAGGGDDPTAPRSVTMSADDTSLPLNIGGDIASIGSPYTTTIYVNAQDGNGRPVATANFSCSIVDALPSGALYYLDGDPEHEEELDVTADTPGAVCTPDGECTLTVPLAYRAVVLETSSGTASFHYHTTDLVGSAIIRCAIADNDGVVVSKDIVIQVGGANTGRVSQVIFDQINVDNTGRNYLYRQGLNEPTQAQIQARLVDEAGQPIATPAAGVNNLYVTIVPNSSSSADDTATLRGVNGNGATVSGQAIAVQGIVGQVQFALVSGSATGTIELNAVSDRADNNVDNGIQERVENRVAVVVVSSVPVLPTAMTITTATLPVAQQSIPYGAMLEVDGGTLPYTWRLVEEQLPTGLSFLSSGLIAGTPTSGLAGTYAFVVEVTDSFGTTARKQYVLSYTVPTAPTAPAVPLSITSGNLTNGTFDSDYLHIFTASGGTQPYKWLIEPALPAGLSLNADTGVITGTPEAGSCVTLKRFAITVEDADEQRETEDRLLTISGCP